MCRRIKALANEKSPGCDGLTAEFYKTFSSVIGNDLVDVIYNGFEKGELSITMRRGGGGRFDSKRGGEKTQKLATDIVVKL